MPNDLRDKIKNLSPQQIRALMVKKNPEVAGGGVVERRADGIYPASKAQERFWFLSQLYEGTSLYNIPLAVQLNNTLVDQKQLTKAINYIISQNEIFRTTFHEQNDKVVQKIHASLNLKVEYEDISSLEYDDTLGDHVEKIGVEHGCRPFDVAKLPLLAVKLLKTGENNYVILLNLHHLISDGWTNSLLSQDLIKFAKAVPAPSEQKANLQYIDYVEKERNWLSSSGYSEQLDFWKQELENLPLPYKFPKDEVSQENTNEGGRENVDIPLKLHQQIVSFCSHQNCTLFHFYMTCYVILLSKYADTDDLIVGTPVANRGQRKFLNTYGLFMNSLPMRFGVNNQHNFTDILAKYKKNIEGYIEHQEIPYGEIINTANVTRDTQENPLFNVHFAFQHFPQQQKQSDFYLLPLNYGMSKFDLNCWVEISGDSQTLSITYRKGQFSEHKINQFMRHFLLLAEGALSNPTSPISELEYIPTEDFSSLGAHGVNTTQENWFKCYQQSAQSFPNETAIVDSQGMISYSDLESAVANAAKNLQAKKNSHGDIVIIQCARNRNYIFSLLACMRIGATYLPVDHNIPSKKLQHIIEDSGASILLSDNEADTINTLSFASLNEINSDGAGLKPVNLANEDIAYIIYTSGTTGAPKGVCVSYGALTNYCFAMRARINDPSIKSFAHMSALDADLGNSSIFLALGFGGALMLPDKDTLLDPVLLSEFFTNHPVDAMKIVPSHLETLYEVNGSTLPNKLLISGGEVLTSKLVTNIRQASPTLRIINHYGPAEATIGVLTHEIDIGDSNGNIPVGKPLDNNMVFILDNDLKPVPLGVYGEICIGGANLSSGYFNQSEMTAEKFVSIPNLSRGKIYRTGDVGYINKHGEVIFIGRNDRQLKISGFRIEAAEVEAVLMEHTSVTNAFVWRFNGQLCAVVKASKPVDALELRSYLAGFFQQALIPSISIVDNIPLTSNGKVDAQQVESLFSNEAVNVSTGLPKDIVELRLVDIFKETLGLSSLSSKASFFDLGGHSLLAISLMTKINQKFATDFRIAILFQYNSVEQLGALIRQDNNANSDDSSPYVSLSHNNKSQKLVWIHPAGGNVMSYLPLAQSMSDNYDTAAFMAMEQGAKASQSIANMAQTYGAILDKINKVDSNVIAGWSMGALIAHQMAVNNEKAAKLTPLVLADQPIPHIFTGQAISHEERVKTYIEKVEVFTGEPIEIVLTPDGEIDYSQLHTAFIRADLIPPDAGLEGFRSFLDLLVYHNEIISDFKPALYSGPTLLLKAQEKIMLKKSDAQPEYKLHDLGWGKLCSNLTIIEVPGNHMTMLNLEHVSTTSLEIHNWLSGLKTS